MTHAKAERRKEDECNVISVIAPFRKVVLCLSLIAACLASGSANAQGASKAKASGLADAPPFAEGGDESSQYIVQTLAKGLDNPCALAVRPSAPAGGPYELFISESGAGRVVRVTTDKPSEATPAVTGFPTAEFGDNPRYRIGPLGLGFLGRTKLVVGTGGLPEGKDIVQVYVLPAGGAAVAYEKSDHHVGPVPSGPRSKSGEGNFFALAVIDEDVEKALFVTSAADKENGWVLKANASANRLADLQPFIATRKVTGVGAPGAVTVNPKARSHYLVIGQMDERTAERDGVIAFYSPASGQPALTLKTGLYDITGLAYSPGGDLYALDFAWQKPEVGGVYRIEAAEVAGRQSCRAVKIANALRPTALAFTPDGSLYVTALGNRTGIDAPPTGVLLKITPQPGAPKL
jgi:hypothetical protein